MVQADSVDSNNVADIVFDVDTENFGSIQSKLVHSFLTERGAEGKAIVFHESSRQFHDFCRDITKCCQCGI